MTDKIYTMTESELEAMCRRAATEALKDVGLDYATAGQDIKTLRELLSSWRLAKNTAIQTIVKVFTTGLLVILSLGFVQYINK